MSCIVGVMIMKRRDKYCLMLIRLTPWARKLDSEWTGLLLRGLLFTLILHGDVLLV
jgi:hypothetical protein